MNPPIMKFFILLFLHYTLRQLQHHENSMKILLQGLQSCGILIVHSSSDQARPAYAGEIIRRETLNCMTHRCRQKKLGVAVKGRESKVPLPQKMVDSDAFSVPVLDYRNMTFNLR